MQHTIAMKSGHTHAGCTGSMGARGQIYDTALVWCAPEVPCYCLAALQCGHDHVDLLQQLKPKDQVVTCSTQLQEECSRSSSSSTFPARTCNRAIRHTVTALHFHPAVHACYRPNYIMTITTEAQSAMWPGLITVGLWKAGAHTPIKTKPNTHHVLDKHQLMNGE